MDWPWSSADCPVDPIKRDWIHQRLAWLADQFGLETWWDAQAVEPREEFFPDRYDGSVHAAERMLTRVCEYMGVDPERVVLRLYSEVRNANLGLHHIQGAGTAGLYSAAGKEVIQIESSGLNDPMALVATMAHELAHARLLGENRLTGDEEDHEPLTDLAMVFLGLGIFGANSAVVYRQWARENWYGWSAGKQGYTDEPTYGYALAVWTYVRGEEKPKWLRSLRPNVRALVKQSMRYLHAEGATRLTMARRGMQ